MKTIYWLTGQPGAGKTVLAKRLVNFLTNKCNKKAFHIDGDDLRDILINKDYSRAGRELNIKTAQSIAKYLTLNDHDVVVSLVAPYRDIRESFKENSNVIEIYVHTQNQRGREQYHIADYEVPIKNFIDIDTTDVSEDTSFNELLLNLNLQNDECWQKKIHVNSSMINDNHGFSMFLGRWQPLHEGHKKMFSQILDNGKRICIMIRDLPIDENNPYSAKEVKENIKQQYKKEILVGKVIVLIVPNITSINFGRGVGYDIIEHIPPIEVSKISATQIRNINKIT